MASYHMLYMAAALLLLIWIGLAAVMVTIRLCVRDQKSRRQFRHERKFFQDACRSEDMVYMMLGREDRKLWYLSENAERIFGIPKAQVQTDVEVLETLTTAEYRREFRKKWTEWDGKGELLQDFRMERSDGKYTWYELSVTLPGDQEAYLFRFRENTRERAEIERLRDEIRRAQMDVQYKTDFLSNMSHEIRTPMNGILGMLAILERAPDDPVRRAECRRKIRLSTEHLLSLVNDVLQVSKLESGRPSAVEEPFDLHEILEDCIAILSPPRGRAEGAAGTGRIRPAQPQDGRQSAAPQANPDERH